MKSSTSLSDNVPNSNDGSRCKELFKMVPEVIYRLDANGLLNTLSPSFKKITGWNVTDWLGKHFSELVHPEDLLLATNYFKRIMKGKKIPVYELRIRKKTGEYIVGEFISVPEKKDGHIIGKIGVMRDITFHKNREESHMQLGAIIESVDTAIISRTLDGTIVSWNPAAEKLYGYKASEVIGKHILLVMPEERKYEFSNITKKIKKGKHIAFETERVRKDGKKVYTTIRVSPTRNRFGEIIGLSSFSRDITEKKHQEEIQRFLILASKLLSSSLDYTQTVGRVAELVVPYFADWCIVHTADSSKKIKLLTVAHTDKKKIYWAKKLQKNFAEHAWIYKDLKSILISGKSKIYSEITEHMLKDYASETDTLKILREIGIQSIMMVPLASRKQVLGVMTFICSNKNFQYTKRDLSFAEELARRVGQALDNSKLYESLQHELQERNMIEEELRRSRNQLRVILKNVADGITVQDKSGHLIYANEAAALASGYKSSREMLINPTKWIKEYTLLNETGSPYSLEQLPGRKALLGEILAEDTIHFIHKKTGEERWALIKARPVIDETNNIIFVVNVIHDITHIKKMEQRKDDFFGIASHELKTPLTSIKAFTQLLTKSCSETPDEKNTHYLARMNEQIDKLHMLVQDLLDVSKIQSGRLDYKEEVFDIDLCVRQAIEDIQPLTQRHTIVLKGITNKNVFADKYRIEQVITNLLANAIKYSPHANKVVVQIKVEENNIIISVKDFGIGIPKDKVDKIFQRFYRVEDKTRESFPGLGLGLFISNQIINRQGGKLWVKSQEGTGSIFFFTLPVYSQKKYVTSN